MLLCYTLNVDLKLTNHVRKGWLFGISLGKHIIQQHFAQENTRVRRYRLGLEAQLTQTAITELSYRRLFAGSLLFSRSARNKKTSVHHGRRDEFADVQILARPQPRHQTGHGNRKPADSD